MEGLKRIQGCSSIGRAPVSKTSVSDALTLSKAVSGKESSQRRPKNGQKVDTGFEQFWSLYPRKVKKGRARKAWGKLTGEQQEDAVAALPSHLKHWAQIEIELQFIPHPSTWLSDERWEDELVPNHKFPKGPRW